MKTEAEEVRRTDASVRLNLTNPFSASAGSLNAPAAGPVVQNPYRFQEKKVPREDVVRPVTSFATECLPTADPRAQDGHGHSATSVTDPAASGLTRVH